MLMLDPDPGGSGSVTLEENKGSNVGMQVPEDEDRSGGAYAGGQHSPPAAWQCARSADAFAPEKNHTYVSQYKGELQLYLLSGIYATGTTTLRQLLANVQLPYQKVGRYGTGTYR